MWFTATLRDYQRQTMAAYRADFFNEGTDTMNANRLPSGPQSLLLNRAADYTDEWGVRTLVAKIQTFWNAKGKYPQVWAERETIQGASNDANPLWVVRSDMVGGRPL